MPHSHLIWELSLKHSIQGLFIKFNGEKFAQNLKKIKLNVLYASIKSQTLKIVEYLFTILFPFALIF